MDRGAWRAPIHRVTESDMTGWLRLSFSWIQKIHIRISGLEFFKYSLVPSPMESLQKTFLQRSMWHHVRPDWLYRTSFAIIGNNDHYPRILQTLCRWSKIWSLQIHHEITDSVNMWHGFSFVQSQHFVISTDMRQTDSWEACYLCKSDFFYLREFFLRWALFQDQVQLLSLFLEENQQVLRREAFVHHQWRR